MQSRDTLSSLKKLPADHLVNSFFGPARTNPPCRFLDLRYGRFHRIADPCGKHHADVVVIIPGIGQEPKRSRRDAPQSPLEHHAGQRWLNENRSAVRISFNCP